jgi:hypothetical protein
MFLAIPMPIGSSIEILKKPQVVKSGDVISLRASANSAAYATIVYETTVDADYKRSSAIATSASAATLYTSTGAPSVIESIKVANVDSAAQNHAISIRLTNSSDVIKGHITNNLIVPTGATIEVCENPKFMATGDKLVIQSTFDNALSVFVSAKSVT